MLKLYIIFIGFLLYCIGVVTWFNSISLSDYKKIKSTVQEKVKENKVKNSFNNVDIYCDSFKNWQNYYISPWCFLKNSLPKLWLKKSSDIIFPFINGFDNIYKLNSKEFTYKPAKVSFLHNYSLDYFIDKTLYDKLLLYVLWLKNYYIKVPETFLALNEFENYSIYVSSKDLSKRNYWRLNNFNIAMNEIDDYLFQPQEEINFNKLIANKPWYSKGSKQYLFYAWVCWVSTMFFRNAIINPYLYVTKRYNHAQRYVNFYSPYIYWDDASVYEYIKTLKIKNNSTYPIYLKKKNIWENIYFTSIVPKKSWKIAHIIKEQTKSLTAKLSSTVFDENANILYEQSWVSNYLKKNFEN